MGPMLGPGANTWSSCTQRLNFIFYFKIPIFTAIVYLYVKRNSKKKLFFDSF